MTDIEFRVGPQHRRISDTIARDIGRLILDGTYQPGDRLPQDRIMAAYAVANGVCREAMAKLLSKGMIVAGPNVGTRVTEQIRWNLLDPEVLQWAPADGWLFVKAAQARAQLDPLLYESNPNPLLDQLYRILDRFVPGPIAPEEATQCPTQT